MQSIPPGRFTAIAVSTGVMALLLSLPSQPVDAEPSVDAARVEHLQSLLVEHDLRYALRTYAKGSSECADGDVELGQ